MAEDNSGIGVSRRNMLKITSGGIVGLAGCAGSGGTGDGTDGTTEPSGTTDDSDRSTDTTQSGNGYPSQTINWWIPFSKGGGQDIGQRNLAPYLEEELGVSFALSNKTGGGSGVALQQLANNVEPDGYTISGTFLEYSYLMQAIFDFNYDPTEFEPIYQWSRYPFVITVDTDSEYQSVDDLIEASKEEELTWGQVALGGPDHLSGLLLEEQTEFQGRPVPFNGGGETAAALLGGRVDFAIPTVAAAKPRVDAGEMRPLVMFAQSRDEPDLEGIFPDTPIITELDNIDNPWQALSQRGAVAPPGTPEEKINTLTQAFENATAKEEYQQQASANNEILYRRGPEGYMESLNSLINQYEQSLPMLKESVERLQD
jgi:tripartite-type tricarboxylate transporter receptor subunit TctC